MLVSAATVAKDLMYFRYRVLRTAAGADPVYAYVLLVPQNLEYKKIFFSSSYAFV